MRAEPTGTRALPIDPPLAALAIEDASDRQQIFDLLLRAARSKTRFAALLSVHAEFIRGRAAIADDGFDTSQIENLRLPRDTVAGFEAVIASRTPAVGSIATGEPFIDGFMDMLGGAPRAALVLPIVMGHRTVALVVAHRGDAELTPEEVSDLGPLVVAGSRALVRVLAGRSNAATVPDTAKPLKRPSDDGYDVEVSVPTVVTKRNALATHRENQAWDELVDGIRELIRDGMEKGEPDEDEQLELLLELGHVEAEKLGRPDRAIEAWRSAQTIDASDSRVLDALEALFVQQGRWLECVELLEKRVALTEELRPRIAMLLNLAALAHERLEDDALAVEAYEKVLAADPGHELASRELELLYAARAQWQPLTALLLERASRHPDPETCVAALESVARIQEHELGDARAAFLVWLAVFRREPERPSTIEHLERLAPATKSWDEILAESSVLAEELESQHPLVAGQLWHQIGRWMRDHVANRPAAVRALDRASRLDPGNADALAELIDMLRTDGRWDELIGCLSIHAETEQDPGRRCELNAELGDIYEMRLGRPGEAIAFYERAHTDEPESTPVLVALHRLYLATESWDALALLLPQLIEALGPSTPRSVIVDLHVELGTVLADHLGRSDDATAAFRDALALDPKNAAAFAGIAKVADAAGSIDSLLDIKEAEADAGAGANRLQRYADLAAAWHDHGRLERAAACWQKLLALDPRNANAHRGLARALRDAEQWDALAMALRAHVKLVSDPTERVALLLDLGGVLETRLDDVDGALAVLHDVTAIDPHNRAALDALARLHDRTGHWQPALDALNRLLADATNDPRARGDLLQRIGQVQLSAHDLASAQVSFTQAIGADPTNAKAHEGTARLHLAHGKLVAAAEQLLRAAQLSADRADSLRCITDAAWVYRHRIGDAERARECLQRILEIDPDHADAKQALSELLHDMEQWETLWPHLEEQVRHARQDTSIAAAERHETFARAARCAVELGKFPTAIELYDQALAVEPRPDVLIDRAEALYRSHALEAAAASYQTIVTRPGAALDRDKQLLIYRRLAAIHTELGKMPQAQMFLNKVLDIDPHDQSTLLNLTDIHQERGHIDEAIASLRSLVATGSTAERIGYLERIGDLYREKLANPPRAMSTYMEALELDGGNHRILQRVLDLQSETGQWKGAVETIARFLEHETDPGRRGVYYLASAEIRRTHLKDRAGALECYEAALDEMFREQPLGTATRARALEAFQALHDLVAGDDNWKGLEQAFRRMIKRLPKDDPILIHLWQALGEVYRSKLQHPQSAIEALEVAHALDPEKSPERARVLAELYAQIGKKQPEQVSARVERLVEVDPTNPDAYRALGRSAFEAGRIDEAWCVARALVFLKHASTEEDALYRRYKSQEVRKASGILDEDSWALLRHPDEDRTISAIFALTWESAVALRAGPAKAFELKPKERLAIEESTGVVAKIFKHAARVLNVALPDVYVQPKRSGRLLLANCVEKGRLAPAVIVGRDLMTGFRDTEIAAAVGAMLAVMRPAYYLKLTLPAVEELEAALAAAAALVGRKIGRPELEPMVATLVGEMQNRVTRPVGEQVLALVNRLPERPDVARWRNAVDAAAQRAGFLVSGDLAAAARMISSEATSLGGLRPSHRVQELVAFSVSANYFALRKHLNLAVA